MLNHVSRDALLGSQHSDDSRRRISYQVNVDGDDIPDVIDVFLGFSIYIPEVQQLRPHLFEITYGQVYKTN